MRLYLQSYQARTLVFKNRKVYAAYSRTDLIHPSFNF